jgi:hypothetical protein
MCNGVTIILPNTSKGNPFHTPIPLGTINSNKDMEPTLGTVYMLAKIIPMGSDHHHTLPYDATTMTHILKSPVAVESNAKQVDETAQLCPTCLNYPEVGQHVYIWMKLTISPTCGFIITPMIVIGAAVSNT